MPFPKTRVRRAPIVSTLAILAAMAGPGPGRMIASRQQHLKHRGGLERRNVVEPDVEHAQRRQLGFDQPRSRISRPCSRFQSRSASVLRLSCIFLPLAMASCSFTMPRSLK